MAAAETYSDCKTGNKWLLKSCLKKSGVLKNLEKKNRLNKMNFYIRNLGFNFLKSEKILDKDF